MGSIIRAVTVVALRKESVDRNTTSPLPKKDAMPSLSARRAWIEMSIASISALVYPSLSARRAWIEMPQWSVWGCKRCVALRKESVDRNDYLVFVAFGDGTVALRKESVDRNILEKIRQTILK